MSMMFFSVALLAPLARQTFSSRKKLNVVHIYLAGQEQSMHQIKGVTKIWGHIWGYAENYY